MGLVIIGPKATLPSLRRRRNLAPATACNNITIKYITSSGISFRLRRRLTLPYIQQKKGLRRVLDRGQLS